MATQPQPTLTSSDARCGAVRITSTCTVFAESEIISLVAHGEQVDRILLGLHAGLVSRILAMVRSVGLVPPLLLSGGVARNTAMVALLEQQSGRAVRLPSRPQLMGAYGAALLAAEVAEDRSDVGPAGPEAAGGPGVTADPGERPFREVKATECDRCAEPPPRRGLLGAFRRS